jgi:hypothetical protein
MVRNSTEQKRKTVATADVPAGARPRSFAGTDLGFGDKAIERDVLARADEDFERLFGAD